MTRIFLTFFCASTFAFAPITAEAHTFGIWRWLGLGFGDGIHVDRQAGEFAHSYVEEVVVPAEEVSPAVRAAHPGTTPGVHRSQPVARQGWHHEIRLLPPVAQQRSSTNR